MEKIEEEYKYIIILFYLRGITKEINLLLGININVKKKKKIHHPPRYNRMGVIFNDWNEMKGNETNDH